jgi:hypothetical protein
MADSDRHTQHAVFDHGGDQEWAEWLASCRTAILGEFGPGHPFYEEWLAPSVSDPSSVPRLVAAYIERMRAVNEACFRAVGALIEIGANGCREDAELAKRAERNIRETLGAIQQ